MKDVSKGAKQI